MTSNASVTFVNLFGFIRTNIALFVEQTNPPVGSVRASGERRVSTWRSGNSCPDVI
jgi:hypothetical protein